MLFMLFMCDTFEHVCGTAIKQLELYMYIHIDLNTYV